MFGKSWEMIKRGMAVALSVSLLAGAMSVSSSLPTAAASTKRVEVGTKGNVTINLDGREVWQAAADAMQKAQPVTGDIADRIMAQTGSNGNPVVLEDDIYKMELPAKALKGLPTGLGMEMYISAGAEDVAEDYTAAEEGEAAAVVAEVASASDLEATGVAEKPVRDFFASSMFSLIKENDEAAPAGGAAAAGGEGYELNGSEHIYFVLSNATDQDVNYTVKLGDLEILKTKVLKSHGDTTGVIGASVSDLIGVPASTSNMVRATESDMATASNLMEEAELTDDVVAKVVRTTLKNFFIIYRSEETALGTKAMVVTTADMKFKSKDGGVFTTRGDKMVLAVRDIDKNSEEYKQAAATLQNNNVDHADFAAVDISFRKGGADEDYEPCQGQIVNVRIETKAIENFDPESMSIQHHLDDGSLETVAGTTKKTVVEISDDAAEAVNNTVAVTEDQQTEITVEKKEDENVYTFDEEANKAAMEAQLSTAGKSEFKMEVGDGETALTNDVKESGAPKKASAAQTEVKKNSVTKTISSAVDANGVKTEVQEEQGNGDIKVEDGKVVADFVVDSFSIYTIIGQQINTVEYLSKDGNTYKINLDLTEVTNIPEGATLEVKEYADDEAEEYVAKALKALDSSSVPVLYSKVLDLSIIYNNEKIQPDGPVKVEMTLLDKDEDVLSEVVHFGEETEVLEAATDGKSVSFETEEFSPFAFVGQQTISQRVITANGESFTIEVTYGPEAEIPAGAKLEAREILEGTEEYSKYLSQTKKAFAEEPSKEAVKHEKTDNVSELDSIRNLSITAASEARRNEKVSEVKQSIDEEINEKAIEESIGSARFFDISIVSGDAIIEPLAPVQVNIKYDDPVKLEENGQIKAVHFAKAGTEVIDVKTNEDSNTVTDITFTQDSFSVTGTVVQYLSAGWPNNGDYVMIVKPYNSNNYYAVKNDGEITSVNYNANTGKVTFSDLTSVEQVGDYWWTKSDSYYNGWKYFTNGNNYLNPNNANALSTSADSVARTTNGNLYNRSYGYGTSDNYLLVNENSLQIEGQGSSNSGNRAVVFFANDFQVDEVPEPGEDPTEVDLGAPGTGKTIKSNDDGTYQLALSVTGKSQAQDSHSTADIIVVFDTSGSMAWDENGDETYYDNDRRITKARNAINSLARQLLENNTEEYPDTIRLSLITFATRSSIKTFTNSIGNNQQTNNLNAFMAQVPTRATGGTNWEEALQQVSQVSTRSDAAKYVIFVSDGNPTFRMSRGNSNWYDNDYYDRYGVYGNGNDNNATTVSRCYQMARDDAKAIVDSEMEFYTIGVYGNVNRMSNLTAYAYTGNDGGAVPSGHYQTASNTEALNEAFANIINDINKNFSYTDVEIDDGITALTATALVTGTVNNYEYKITYVDAADNQTHTVSATKNSDGTLTIPSVTYNTKSADGTTKSVTTSEVTVKGAAYDGEKVTWALDKSDGTNYKLENGWTYEVSFTVWPTQRAYDLIADLANGNVTYDSLSDEVKASIDQATLTLKTNSEASVTYRQITTTNGVDGEPSEPKTVGIDNPPGVPLAGSDLKIVKHWNDDLDPTQLLDLLTDHLNDAGTDVDYTVTLDVVQDKGTSAEEHVHTADYPDGFVYKPNVTIEGGKVTAATWPEIDIAVAPGIMVTYEHAHAHGFDTAVDSEGNPKYRTVEFDGVTYYIIEEGHRYEITERSVDYHFELLTDIDHLMIIDGVLKNVVHNDDGSIKEISQNPSNLTELGATNSLKGGINLYKFVEDAEGTKITPKDDVFTVKCKLVDEDGNPYTRASETVGDDESNGIVYRVYAPDEELETVYPGKVDAGKNRTVKIGVLNSSEFNVQLKAGWTIRFINVPSNTKWEFEEINIPDKYEIDLTGTEEVDGTTVPKTRGMSGTVLTNTANDAQITNKMTKTSLTVKKIVSGNMGNKTDRFKFVVSLSNNGSAVTDWVPKYKPSTATVTPKEGSSKGEYTFELGHDESIEFTNIPIGYVCKVVEDVTSSEGYEVTYNLTGINTDGVAATSDGLNVQVTNTRNSTVPTGIHTDSTIWRWLIGACFLMFFGSALYGRRKRRQ